jgi:hypothetical protein
MRTIFVATATAIAMLATAAQATSWDPANSSRDRQLLEQGMIGIEGAVTSSAGSRYEPASDRGARLVPMSTMSPVATNDSSRTGVYPTYDPASNRGARFGE